MYPAVKNRCMNLIQILLGTKKFPTGFSWNTIPQPLCHVDDIHIKENSQERDKSTFLLSPPCKHICSSTLEI